ncbi:MAG TPA: YhcH/YjgK/YiaL family protein [Prolixibacteraceae bacterium]|nr:YhcH/YjgK/YiaL family protein [Prolixibacteraceae bacterium]
MEKLLNTGFRAIIFISAFLISISCLSQAVSSLNKKEVAKWYKSQEWLNGLKLKPHESTNDQEFERQYHANKIWWDKTFEWLKANDLDKITPGRYVIDEGNVIATDSEAPAPEIDKVKWESHKNFNDLQYIIKGKASMGVSPLSTAEVTEAYDSKKDAAFYDADGKFYIGEPGTFFIFTPKDVHRPGIKISGDNVVKKIVIKIRAIN